jgi:hypothetical protein
MVEGREDLSLPDLDNSLPGGGTPMFPRRLWNQLVSPYGWAFISYAFFLFSWLIPPSLYSHYLMEPDLMFLDPATILFYTLCVVSFVAGVAFVRWLFPRSFNFPRIEARTSPAFFLMAPLIAGIALTAASLFVLLTVHPAILLLLAAQQGADLKELISTEISSTFNLPPLLLTGIMWWAFWRSFDLRLSRWNNRLFKAFLVIAMLSVVVMSTVILSRDILMMAICGLAILYALRRSATTPLTFKFVFKTAATIAIVVVPLFIAVSLLRGSISFDDQVYQILGYTAASYNRLAAVVNGSLRYPYAGRGLYLSSFFAFNHTWNRFVPLGMLMNWPDQLEVWATEFGAVTRAGLNGALIWSGTFGYIFSDLGWFSIPFVFGYGLLYGIAWNWIRSGKVLGIVMYPCFGYCALGWMGANGLLDSQRAVLFASALVLACYEFVFTRRKRILPQRAEEI